MMPQNIWSLRSADKGNLSLIPHDLDYFQNHFVGKAMTEQWNPPPVKISGKSLRLRDFVSWMVQAPVISERAKVSLQPVLGEHVEFLPLLKLRGIPYYAVNVLELVTASISEGRKFSIQRVTLAEF